MQAKLKFLSDVPRTCPLAVKGGRGLTREAQGALGPEAAAEAAFSSESYCVAVCHLNSGKELRAQGKGHTHSMYS